MKYSAANSWSLTDPDLNEVMCMADNIEHFGSLVDVKTKAILLMLGWEEITRELEYQRL